MTPFRAPPEPSEVVHVATRSDPILRGVSLHNDGCVLRFDDDAGAHAVQIDRRAGAVRAWSVAQKSSAVRLPEGLEGRDRARLLALVERVERAAGARSRVRCVVRTAHGFVALTDADRSDELEVAPLEGHGDASQARVVSLGRAMRFACASAGGTRIALVARGEHRLVVRTLATDLRTELNAVPLDVRAGCHVGAVSCAYAGGVFVVLHEERGLSDDGRSELVESVLTAFDGRAVRSTRVAGALGAIAADGRDLLLAGLGGARAGALLTLQRAKVTQCDGAWAPQVQTDVGLLARDVLVLARGPFGRVEERRALLADVADALTYALARRVDTSALDGARGVRFASRSRRSDEAQFILRTPAGRGLEDSMRVRLVLRADGTGYAQLTHGGDEPALVDASAWMPREPGIAERVLRAMGLAAVDDPGIEVPRARTARVDARTLADVVAPLVRAVWVLRAAAQIDRAG